MEIIRIRVTIMNNRTLYRLFTYIILSFWTSTFGQSVSNIVELIREGHTRQARDLLIQIEEDIPQESSLFLRGLLSMNADSALTYYEALLKTNPHSRFSDLALYRMAQLKYSQGLYKTAQNLYFRLLIEYPLSPHHQSCYFWLGLCYQAMGQTDSATVYLRKTVEDFPHTEITEIARRDLDALIVRESKDLEQSPQVSEKRWAVQVFAFTDQNRALLRKSFFEQKGYSVNLRTKHMDDDTYYLVWVGSFETRDEAYQFGEMLKKRYNVKNYILVSE